jgi:nicotinate-nucleotide--dimethylbenzimidazole phosphoribosyltransferase
MAAHRSAEPAHGALLEKLGKRPILDLGMRLGEASGAVLAAATVMAAARVHAGMATFASAGISGREE